MITINPHLRITESGNNTIFSNDKYLYNSTNGKEAVINNTMYSLIKTVNYNNPESFEILHKIEPSIFNNKFAANIINDMEIFCEVDNPYTNLNILEETNLKYPLKSLSIEIIENCDLNCIHCYGAFGKKQISNYISYEYLNSLKESLDILQTRSIALTGGELLLHPELESILGLFLTNGFKLTLFSNCFNTNRLSEILEKFKSFNFHIQTSIDGLEEYHNKIRGVNTAFQNTVNSINLIQKYKNVSLGISTTIMKSNIHLVDKIEKYFSPIDVQFQLAFPIFGEPNNEIFTVNDFKEIYGKIPQIFPDNNKKNRRKHRCDGGVVSATIDSHLKLRICNAARDDKFIIGDLNNGSLLEEWINPNNNGIKYRKEKANKTTDCLKCKYKHKCDSHNCRILSFNYLGSEDRSDPFNCFCREMCKC